MSNRKYSEEFRKSAVKLVTELGYSYNEAAEQLGCSSWSIRQWTKKYSKIKDVPPEFEHLSAADEMKKIREENARLRMENEILKKRQRRTLPRSPYKVRLDRQTRRTLFDNFFVPCFVC